MKLDAVIFGGGIAGLWLLHEMRERGYRALLLETAALGNGQTVASQGIIHGGLKYALTGWVNRSARNIREMPNLWRAALAGESGPNLSNVQMRSEHCHLWRTTSLKSRLGFLAARFALRVTPKSLPKTERPSLLRDCPGLVAKMSEPVLSPRSLIEELSRPHRNAIIKIDASEGMRIETSGTAHVSHIGLTSPSRNKHLVLSPHSVIFAAGAGNEALCQQVGLSTPRMQRRPLHMVTLRGPLPELNGHCIDGSKTRLTITSDMDRKGRRIWQLGGQIAELGVNQSPAELVSKAKAEVQAVLPALNLTDVEASTYRVDRAEGLDSKGRRPDDIMVSHTGNIVVGWPTKLALAPRLADEILNRLPAPSCGPDIKLDWDAPSIAEPPWERMSRWTPLTTAGKRAA